MGNPDDEKADERTIINVKGVRKSAWEAAKRGATQEGDSMGTWLSDAIDQRVTRDANKLIEPGNLDPKQGNPEPLTPDQITQRIMAVAALQQSTAAVKQATGRATGKNTLLRCLASLELRLEEAEGRQPVRLFAKGNQRNAMLIGAHTQ